jgi:C1A family cysteine protease/photosystem II stability/assembly factor-like uncharacterized protein
MKSIFTFTLSVLLLSFTNLFSQDYWHQTNVPGTFGKIYSIVFHPNTTSTLIAGTETGGILKSTDSGDHWFQSNSGLTPQKVNEIFIKTDGNIYAGTSSGVYYSTNYGNSWTSRGLSGIDIRSIGVGTNGYLYVATSGGVRRSTNNGANWTLVNSGFQNLSILALLSLQNGDILAADSPGSGFQGSIYKSTDYGSNWVLVQSHGSLYVCFAKNYFSNDIYFFSAVNSVYKSTDNGSSWSAFNVYSDVRTDALINDVGTIFFSSRDHIAYPYNYGIFRSLDNGNTWSQKNSGLNDLNVYSLGILPDGFLLAGVSDGGIYKSVTSTTQPKIRVEPSAFAINENNIFLDNIEQTYEQSIIQDSRIYSLGLIIPDSVKEYWSTHNPKVSYNPSEFLSSIDWSTHDSPVKNQGSCGACWAFAAVALVENLGLQNDLSEQDIISCAYAGDCGGGFYGQALNYIKNHGISPESCYPYTYSNGNCGDKCQDPAFLEKITTFDQLWGWPAELNNVKGALQSGPIVVSFSVYADLYDYTDGIYTHSYGAYVGGHAVLVVGYDDAEQCFKFKNSWGTSWGEDGYCRISYSDVSSEVCFGSHGTIASKVFTESNNEYTIYNDGQAPLTINTITTNSEWLTTFGHPTTPFSIEPADKQVVACNIDWGQLSTQETGTITLDTNEPYENPFLVNVTAIPASSQISNVNIKVFLEGPYSGNGAMTTNLNTNNRIPHNSDLAYSTELYDYAASIAGNIPNSEIVDWVLVELRTGTSLATKVITRAVFLKSDGSIVDLDGTNPVNFTSVPWGNYYLVIRHRNHLAIMTAAAIPLSNSTFFYDFSTTQTKAYGTEPMKNLGGGVFGMYTGDGNQDGLVTSTDFNVFNPKFTSAASGYEYSDWNLDGFVTSTDFNFFNPNFTTAKQSFVP